jgi:hypothetical protein
VEAPRIVNTANGAPNAKIRHTVGAPRIVNTAKSVPNATIRHAVGCPHGKRHGKCIDCISIDDAIKSRYFCSICTTTMLTGKNRREIGICAGCDKTKRTRIEHIMRDMMLQGGLVVPPAYMDSKMIGGTECGSDRTRPDFVWVLPDRIVHVENDEGSHRQREVSCELKKLDASNWGLSDFGLDKLPTWTLRVNCDEYDGRSLEERVEVLVVHVNRLLQEPLTAWDTLRTNVQYMFYHSKGQKHIDAAKTAVESLVVHDSVY